jgi:hypothetical protein
MNDEIIDNDDTEIMNEDGSPVDGVPEKTIAERAKEIGRDGAYLEVDASDLVKACRSGDLQKAKIIVVSARIEIPNPDDVQDLITTVEYAVAQQANKAANVASLDDEQLSRHIMQKMLLVGLKSNEETKKARSKIQLRC